MRNIMPYKKNLSVFFFFLFFFFSGLMLKAACFQTDIYMVQFDSHRDKKSAGDSQWYVFNPKCEIKAFKCSISN